MALHELAIVEAVASGSLWLGIKKADECVNVRVPLMEWRLDEATRSNNKKSTRRVFGVHLTTADWLLIQDALA